MSEEEFDMSLLEAQADEEVEVSSGDDFEDPQETITQLLEEKARLEREKNGILQDLRSTRTETSMLRGRFDQLAEQWDKFFSSQQKPEETEPEFEDPFEKQEYMYKKLEEKLEQKLGEISGNFSQQKQAQTLQQALLVAKQQAAEFQKENNDFEDAYNFARNYHLNHFKTTYGLDDMTAVAALNQEEAKFVISALQSGANPAAVIYDMAHKLGYQPSESDSEDNEENVLDFESAKPKSKLSTTKPKSLSKVSGKSKKRFDLARIAEEDPDKFNEILEDVDKWERLMRKVEGSEGIPI